MSNRGRPKEDGIITERQEKTLRWFARGLKTREVAEKLDSNPNAVQTELGRIRQRLHANTNMHAIILLLTNVDPS